MLEMHFSKCYYSFAEVENNNFDLFKTTRSMLFRKGASNMGFFSKMFKHDQELEEQQRKQVMEKQVELWKKQAEMGQPVNIQADMEKIYGLDKLEQKQREKQQTKEIVKGAVIGGIVAGDAGAIVGAMAAKNKIDDRNINQNNSITTTQYINVSNSVYPSAVPSNETPSTSAGDTASGSNTPDSLKFCKSEKQLKTKDANEPEILEFYNSEYWQSQKEDLIDSKICRTGRLLQDIALCVDKLTVLTNRDLAEIMGVSYGIDFLDKTEAAIKSLEENKEIVSFSYNRKRYLVKASEYGLTSIKNVAKASDSLDSYYGSDEWNEVFDEVDAETPTGDLEKDILYCLSRVKVINIWDLSGMWDQSDVYKLGPEHHCMIEAKLTALINAGKVRICEYEDDFVLVDVNAAEFIADDVDANDENVEEETETDKFAEIKKYKELLDNGIISQEEFDIKKKELLGL